MKIHIISHDILLSDIVDTIASFFHADITPLSSSVFLVEIDDEQVIAITSTQERVTLFLPDDYRDTSQLFTFLQRSFSEPDNVCFLEED